MFISKTPASVPHTLQVGDWDTKFVAEGETVEFYELALDGSSWAVEVTDAKFGDSVILSHWLEWGVADTNVPGLGLKEDHFKQTADILTEIDPTIFCDDENCLGMNACSDYAGRIPDYEFGISNKKNYTIAGDKLLLDIPMDGYKCMFAFYNSKDDLYHLGDVFLRDYYVVYDLDNYKLGFGRAKDFNGLDEVGPDDDGPGASSTRHELMANLLIFFGIVTIIALVALWVCKKRGHHQELRHRFPLVDEAANSTGSLAEQLDGEPDARPESLRFIERTEEEREADGDKDEDDAKDADLNDTVQAHEANRLNFNEPV